MEKTMGLDSAGVTCSEFCGVKPRLAVASNQTKLSVSAIVNVSMSVEKWLLTGYLLKVAILTVSFYEIKSCGVIP